MNCVIKVILRKPIDPIIFLSKILKLISHASVTYYDEVDTAANPRSGLAIG